MRLVYRHWILNSVSWESHATKVQDAARITTNWGLARPEIRQLGTAKGIGCGLYIRQSARYRSDNDNDHCDARPIDTILDSKIDSDRHIAAVRPRKRHRLSNDTNYGRSNSPHPDFPVVWILLNYLFGCQASYRFQCGNLIKVARLRTYKLDTQQYPQ